MPMSAAALGQLIEDKLEASLTPTVTAGPDGAANVRHLTALAIAEAVVEHITQAAQVLPGIPVATAGSPSAQTGATTAPGTIA